MNDLAMKFPRPRFSLKVLMLVVAAAGIFCAYHVKWIRERHEFLARNAARNAPYDNAVRESQTLTNGWVVKRTAGLSTFSGPPFSYVNGKYSRKSTKSLVNFLWLFSEPRHDSIVLAFSLDQQPRGFLGNEQLQAILPKEECELAERLFPEADFQFRLIWLWKNDNPN